MLTSSAAHLPCTRRQMLSSRLRKWSAFGKEHGMCGRGARTETKTNARMKEWGRIPRGGPHTDRTHKHRQSEIHTDPAGRPTQGESHCKTGSHVVRQVCPRALQPPSAADIPRRGPHSGCHSIPERRQRCPCSHLLTTMRKSRTIAMNKRSQRFVVHP